MPRSYSRFTCTFQYNTIEQLHTHLKNSPLVRPRHVANGEKSKFDFRTYTNRPTANLFHIVMPSKMLTVNPGLQHESSKICSNRQKYTESFRSKPLRDQKNLFTVIRKLW